MGVAHTANLDGLRLLSPEPARVLLLPGCLGLLDEILLLPGCLDLLDEIIPITEVVDQLVPSKPQTSTADELLELQGRSFASQPHVRPKERRLYTCTTPKKGSHFLYFGGYSTRQVK